MRRSVLLRGTQRVAGAALVLTGALTIYGCATHTAATSLGLGSNETLAAGRFRVAYNGDDVTKKVYFNLKNSSGAVFRIDQDESGFFVARLAPGSYELTNIVFSKAFAGAFAYDFETRRAVIDLPTPGKIYDVGLISIDWTGPGVKMGTYFGVIGAIVDVGRGNGQAVITVSDDSADLASELYRRFGTHPEIVGAPLRTGDAQGSAASTPAQADPEPARHLLGLLQWTLPADQVFWRRLIESNFTYRMAIGFGSRAPQDSSWRICSRCVLSPMQRPVTHL